jgi:uncharacterized repeat protein (TIGR01451 family)
MSQALRRFVRPFAVSGRQAPRIPWFEHLEDRRLLASDLSILSVSPTGAGGAPFDGLEVRFSHDVDPATFSLDDITVTTDGGLVTPLGLAQLSGTRFSLDLTGLTDLATLVVTVGPDITSLAGSDLDQDGDGVGGEPIDDVHTTQLFSSSIDIAAADSTHDGKSVYVYGATATIDGAHNFTDLVLLGGATATHSYTTADVEYGMELALTGLLQIDATSAINVSNRGYLTGRTVGNTTVGAATQHSGGSYGGLGFDDADGAPNWTYGDYLNPNELGSGGGESWNQGGHGGGLVRLSAATAQIDGSILARGGNGYSYGNTAGSGGGIRLDLGTVSGEGLIAADGGDGYGSGGSGGGGRIAVYYDTNDDFELEENITAHAGTGGSGTAAVGTVYLEQAGQQGVLRLDSHGETTSMWTPLGSAGDASFVAERLVIAGAGVAAAPMGVYPIELEDLEIAEGGVLTHRYTTTGAAYTLDVDITGSLFIDATSAINVSNRGYVTGYTVGNTTNGAATQHSGGSYGGLGFDDADGAPNWTYGDYLNPNELGSGGGESWNQGGHGGGLVRLSAATAEIDGSILARGGNGYSYGNTAGSGGGIRLDLGTVSGEGLIAADGGDGYGSGGSGGGGRIAVYYDTNDDFELEENITAHAGSGGSGTAAVGTVYLKQAGQQGVLRLDSHGETTSMWTPLGSSDDASFVAERLVIAGAGVVAAPMGVYPVELEDLEIAEGGVLTHRYTTTGAAYSLDVDISGSLSIDADSRIDVSNRGYVTGYTVGNTTNGAATQHSGGSYGGLGFDDADGAPNWTYGDYLDPNELGSGGGESWNQGGHGGGLVRLSAATAQLDGSILARGGNGYSYGNTAGSGGGIRLDIGELSGAGLIAADGGDGYGSGGSGGGGRIAVYYDTNDDFELEENITAHAGSGGSGTAAVGTVYLKQAGQQGVLRLDSHGETTSMWTPLGNFGDGTFNVERLVIVGAGVVAAPIDDIPMAAEDIDVLEHGVLTHRYLTATEDFSLDITISGGLTIDATSSINVSNRGYLTGRTVGNTTTGAATLHCGGSYGGLGFDDADGAPNWTYGDYRNPDEFGSGGGDSWNQGGSGGGLVRLTAGNARIDGSILADGGNGYSYGNTAGSGGGIRLDVGELSGGGLVAADGGDGYGSGGSGGGGRVAVYYDALDGFDVEEQVRAHGGDGGSGTAAVGSVFLKDTSAEGVLRLDSHDAATGMWTPLGVAGDAIFDVDRLVIAGDNVIAAPFADIPVEAQNVDILEQGMLTHQYATTAEEFALRLTIAETLFIDADSSINVSNRGYLTGHTVGNTTVGAATLHSGGSYGGLGFDDPDGAPNWTYGDYLNPNELGSGGGESWNQGGRGGGLVRLSADSAQIDGAILAGGGNGYSYGNTAGSGGGIRLDVGELSGEGLIAADGGDGYGSGGSGGGGRIAVYYDTNDDFELEENITAHAGNGGSGTAAVGTVYLKDNGGEGVLRIDSHDATTSMWTPLGQTSESAFVVDRLVIAGAGVVAAPAQQMHIEAGNVDLIEGGILTHRYTTADTTYSLQLLVADTLTIDTASAIDVSNRGYLIGRTSGNSTTNAATGHSGGSYGGLGCSDDGVANPVYGLAEFPAEPGSGGANTWGLGGSGGGLLHLTANTIQVAGAIRADGGNGFSWGNPAGSGGGILIGAASLSGTGFISADGGDGYGSGGSGGGGRIAVYLTATNALSMQQSHLTVDGGAGGAGAGEEGTLVLAENTIAFRFLSPTSDLLHGQITAEWFMAGANPLATTVDLTLTGVGQPVVIGEGFSAIDSAAIDTTELDDGIYDLRAVLRDADGTVLAETVRQILVNNTAVWHSGTVLEDATWRADSVHIVESPMTVAAGVVLTIEPGSAVKFISSASLRAAEGATITANGTADDPIVFTSIYDDAAGGDTNHDQDATLPQPGDWHGVGVLAGGTLNANEHVEYRYMSMTHSGTIATDEVWLAEQLHHITADLTIAAGASLTIMPGAIVKVADLGGIFVQAGASLIAEGTTAQPIVFTSVHDDTVGGDTNDDGDETAPEAGDWRWVYISGDASFDHAHIRYGGGTGGNWNQTGVLRTTGSARLDVANSIISDAFYDGVLAWGGEVNVSNTVLTRIDRAICAHPGSPVQVTNCTVDDNRVGLLIHGGTLNVDNTIVSNSLTSGIQFDFGTVGQIRYTNVWAPTGSGSVNYRSLTDQTGSNGNISVDPQYVNADQDNYRLGYASPMIDAADTLTAPATDHRGAPRYDDPRTANTGVLDGDLAADLGAFEFVETADSDLDLVVVSVSGPSQMTAGETVLVTWQVRNLGTATVSGAWHDRIELVDVLGNTLSVDEVVSSGAMGPGEMLQFTAEVTVPGGTEASYRWQVTTNCRGEVFEGQNVANNAGESLVLASLLIPELPIGGEIDGELLTSADRLLYKIQPESGADVIIRLDRSDVQGWTQLFLGRGTAPTESAYWAASSQFNTPDASVAIEHAGDLTYYVMIVPRSLPSGEVTFTLSAENAAYDLSDIGLTQGANAGLVTIPLEGAQFADGLQSSLIGPTGAQIDATSLLVMDSTLAQARFDLTGLPLGLYDVQVVQDGLTRSLTDVFEVIEGEEGRLELRMMLPDQVRIGREFTAWVEYENVGDTDLLAPLVIVDAASGNLMGLTSGATFANDYVTFLAAGTDGTPSILRPGQQGRAPVYVVGQGGANRLTTAIAYADSANAMNWGEVNDAVHPDFDCTFWDAEWNALLAEYGDEVGGYVGLLGAAADQYLERQGEVSHEPGELLADYVRDLVYDSWTTLDLRLLQDDGRTPIVGMRVTAVPAEGEVYGITKTTADGYARFPNLAAGTYTLQFEGYLAPNGLGTIEVTGDALVSAGDWTLQRGGSLAGRISVPAGVTFTDDTSASITAANADGDRYTGSIQADGRFRIEALPTGTYDLTFTAEALRTVCMSDLTITAGKVTSVYNIDTDAGGSVSGRVTDFATGLGIEGAYVNVTDALGNTQGAVTDADGSYTIAGITPGLQQIIADATGYFRTVLADLTVEQDVATADVDLALGEAASLTGAITDATGPVAGALVNLYDGLDLVAAVSTDATGRYLVPEIPAGIYTIEIDYWSAATHTDTVTIGRADDITFDAELDESATISGIARNSDGTPLAGLVLGLLRPDGVMKIAPTLEDGSYGFGKLDPGDYTLMLLDGSHRQTFSIASDSDAIELNLELAVGSIRGTAKTGDNDGEQETPVTVHLVKNGEVVLYTATNAAGAYSITGVSPGSYSLLFSSNGLFFPIVENVEVVAGENTTVAGITPGSLQLEVTVNDDDTGSAVGVDGWLRVRRQDGSGLPDVDRLVDVSADGVVTLDGLTPGEYELSPIFEGFATQRWTIDLTDQGESIELNLTGQAILAGVVRDGVGNRLEGITIDVFDPTDPTQRWRTTTDELGYYDLEAMPAGSYTVVASDQRDDLTGERLGSVRQDDVVLGEGDELDLALALPAATTIVSGTIATDGGEGPISSTVTIYNAEGIEVATTSTNARGEYTAAGLTPGSYTVRATSPGYAIAALAIDVAADATIAGADLAAVWVGVASGVATMSGDSQMLAMPIGIPDYISIDFSDSGVFNSAWANKIRQKLAWLFGEPVDDSGHLPRPPGLGDCPEALELWKDVVRWQDHANHAFEAWHDRWAAAVDILSADTGKFGVSLMQLAVSMAKAATITDGWKSSFTGAKKQLQDELSRVSDPRSIATLTAQLSNMEALNKRLLLMNALPSLVGDTISDVGNALDGEQHSILGVLDSLANVGSWSMSDFVDTMTDMVGVADELIDIVEGINALTAGSHLKMPAGLGQFVAWANLLVDGINGLVDIYHQFDDVANAKATFDSAVARRNAAYQRVLAAMDAFCDDDDPDDDEPDPPPPPPGPHPPGPPGTAPGIGSYDPNDKATIGVGDDNFITPGTTITYTIRFENVSTATAAAQEVRITDVLDANLDWSTFAIGGLGFNHVELDVPQGLKAYTVVTNVDSDPNPVRITVSLDADTGTVTWLLQSYDPVTSGLPADPLAGFLPPNDDLSSGEGYVTFTIQPLAGLSTGTQISNDAEIIFDVNEPIVTNTVVNTIDAAGPVTAITTPSNAQGRERIDLALQGGDDAHGSGLDFYDVFVSVDGGAYTLAFAETTETNLTYIGAPGHTYRFYSLAHDLVGHVEAAPSTPDATVELYPTAQTTLQGKDNSLSFLDEDGTPVQVKWGKSGSVTVERWLNPQNQQGDIYRITIDGSDAASTLTIKPKGGETNLGGLTVNGPLKALKGKGVNVEGDVTITGGAVKIDLGNVSGDVTLNLGSSGAPAKLGLGAVTDGVSLISTAPIASLKTSNWLAGSLTTPWLGKVTSGLHFTPNLTLSGVGATTYTFSKLTAKAGTIGGVWNVTGLIGSITAGATGATWVGNFTGDVKKLAVLGDSRGSFSARSLLNAKINGNLTNANWTLTLPADPANTKAYALKKLTVNGEMSNSSIRSSGHIGKTTFGAIDESLIFAGVAGALATLPDSVDDFTAEATIAGIKIKGISGQPIAFANSQIAAANLGKIDLRYVDTDNAGTPFGLAAKTLSRFTRQEIGSKYKWPNKTEPDGPAGEDDFVIRLI